MYIWCLTSKRRHLYRLSPKAIEEDPVVSRLDNIGRYSPFLKIPTVCELVVFIPWKNIIGWLVHTHTHTHTHGTLNSREGSGSDDQKLLGSFELEVGLSKKVPFPTTAGRMPVFVILI